MGLRPEARNGSNYVMACILFLNAPPFWAHPHFAPSLLLGPGKDALFGALDAETEIISFSFGPDGVFCLKPRTGQRLVTALGVPRKNQARRIDEAGYRYSVKVSHGDLLLMGGWFQREFVHRLGAHTDPLALHTGRGTNMSPLWLRPSPTLPGALLRPQPGFNANASVLASYEYGASDRLGVNVGLGSKTLHTDAERCLAEGESDRSPPTRSRPLTLNAGRPDPGPGSAW